MESPDEELGAVSQEEKIESTRTNSESILVTTRSRSSLPIVVAWWKNYRRDDPQVVETDENGVYQCIKKRHSPPPEEIELSTSNDTATSPTFHAKISHNSLKQRIFEIMKSTSSASIQNLEDIENGKMTVESAKGILCTSTVMERNITFLCAALNKRVDLLESLFKAEVDIYFSEPTEGFTALHLSAFNDSVDCTEFLISCGFDVNFLPDKYTALEIACFHNSFKVAKLLLENGAKMNVARKSQNKEQTYHGTPLHSAVKANALDCVQLLLAEGADINSTDTGGVSPLHIAAEVGHLQCIKILLESGVDPNFIPPNTKNTALHLAAEGGFSDCISLLLSKGANAETKNHKGQTALHLAARVQSVDCVEMLLKQGSCNPNSEDHDKRTPLHSAVGKSLNSCEIIELLIKWGAQLNGADMYGYTPLHVAALSEHTQCVQVLINNGADVSARTKGGSTALGIIVRKTPLALSTLYKKLDSAILVHDPEVSSSKEVIMKLDFRIFLQRCQKGEISFLKTFLEEGEKEILEHPLCQAFLHIKWEKIRKYYVARLLFYGILVLCLTGYVFSALAFHCYKYEVFNDTLCKNSTIPQFLIDTPDLMTSQWYILMFFIVCEVARKTYALTRCSSLKSYICHIDNVVEWFILISSFLISPLITTGKSTWQNHVAAFAVLFAWINLMFLIGQLPALGSYVAMYIKVQIEFAKLFVAYVCLLIGFTFSFCIIFPDKDYFNNPTFGFIQVIALMIGSVEYDDLVFKESKFTLVSSAHIIFLVFLLFVTIIMMNLLVGIAVRDIQGLQKTAGLSKLVRQTKLISSIELSLFNNWLPNYILMLVRHTALISPSGYRVVLQVKPLNNQEKRLPQDILKNAYKIGKSKKFSNHNPSVSSRILSFIENKQNSTSQLFSEELTHIQNLQSEVEKGSKAIATLTEEIQELKSMIRSMKQL